jgi:hypothetical protein
MAGKPLESRIALVTGAGAGLVEAVLWRWPMRRDGYRNRYR